MKRLFFVLIILVFSTSFNSIKITPLWVCAAYYEASKVTVQIVSAPTKKQAEVIFDRYMRQKYLAQKIDKACPDNHCLYMIELITDKIILK